MALMKVGDTILIAGRKAKIVGIDHAGDRIEFVLLNDVQTITGQQLMQHMTPAQQTQSKQQRLQNLFHGHPGLPKTATHAVAMQQQMLQAMQLQAQQAIGMQNVQLGGQASQHNPYGLGQGPWVSNVSQQFSSKALNAYLRKMLGWEEEEKKKIKVVSNLDDVKAIEKEVRSWYDEETS